MPFEIDSDRVMGKLKLKTDVRHPAVDDGHLDGEILSLMFALDMNGTTAKMLHFTCTSGNRYKLSSEMSPLGNRIFYTIYANLYGENGIFKEAPIYYHFILGYKFRNDTNWYSYTSEGFVKFERPVDISKNHRLARMLSVLSKLLLNLHVYPPVAVQVSQQVMCFSIEFSEILMEVSYFSQNLYLFDL